MRITLFAPYGPFSQESGAIYLLGNYLAEFFPEVSQLKCNGLFSICERDSESSWSRNFDSCMLCMADQDHLQKWSGVTSVDASRFISSEAVESSSRWLQRLNDEELEEAQFAGISVFDFCGDSFHKRVGADFDHKNKRHVQIARRMMMTVVRTKQLVQSYQAENLPQYCFVANGRDLVSRTFVTAMSELPVEIVEFRWDMHERNIQIKRASAEDSMSCNLLLEGVSNMRSDKSTWPDELKEIVNEILDYLDLNHSQLSLPISNRRVVGQ